MIAPTENILKIAYLNCHGQTGLSISKQLQIEDFIKQNKVDILHLQETFIEEDSFSQCKFISSNFNIIHNNSHNKYGTASLVKFYLPVQDVILHHSGRIILFNIENITFGNVYLPSGTDAPSRTSRENFCGEILPTLLVNALSHGVVGGDWNSIIAKEDCTKHPDAKMSPCLRRLVQTFNWRDDYRFLHPRESSFSRYYSQDRGGFGATRIDRSYSFGELSVAEAMYVSIAFSDHLSYITTFQAPPYMQTLVSPRARPFFKTTPVVMKDKVFQHRLLNYMREWQEVKEFGVPVLTWWDVLVKPGIRKLAIERTKEINRERRSHLNLFMMRQIYLTKQVQSGRVEMLPALREVQLRIQDWFDSEVEKVKHQARVEDIQTSEKVRIYHHELHKKHITRSFITKLQTDQGVLEGHKACTKYLQKTVEDLLLNPAVLDPSAQNILLAELEEQSTVNDNEMLIAEPTKSEVEESVIL